MPRARTLAAFRAGLTPERYAAYRQAMRERIGVDLDRTPTKLLDSSQIATLAGVRPGTVTQWKGRTRNGAIRYPFPEERVEESFVNKPMYDPYQVCAWLDWSNKWPPLKAAREHTRGPRNERVPATA